MGYQALTQHTGEPTVAKDFTFKFCPTRISFCRALCIFDLYNVMQTNVHMYIYIYIYIYKYAYEASMKQIVTFIRTCMYGWNCTVPR